MPSNTDRSVPARAALLEKSAIRALDDPVALARAARIVRAALARRRLSTADLEPPIVRPSDLVKAS